MVDNVLRSNCCTGLHRQHHLDYKHTRKSLHPRRARFPLQLLPVAFSVLDNSRVLGLYTVTRIHALCRLRHIALAFQRRGEISNIFVDVYFTQGIQRLLVETPSLHIHVWPLGQNSQQLYAALCDVREVRI